MSCSTSVPSGFVIFPAARPLAPSLREGFPAIFTFMPTVTVSSFQPALRSADTLPLEVILQSAFSPFASVTSTTMFACGLTSLTDFTIPVISTVLSMYQKLLNEWCAKLGTVSVRNTTTNNAETQILMFLLPSDASLRRFSGCYACLSALSSSED